MPARSRLYELPYADMNDEAGSGGLVVYFHILRRRKWTVLLAAFGGILLAFLYTLPQTPIYGAKSTLEVQGLNENFLNMGAVTPTADGGNGYSPELDIQTQIIVLGSRSLIDRVVKKMGGHPDVPPPAPTRLSAWTKALRLPAAPSANAQAIAIATAASNVTLRWLPSTRVVEVSADSTDPAIAARFVNVLTNEFIEQNMEARWQTSERTTDFLGRQLEEFKVKLEQADERLQAYASQSGLVMTSGKDDLSEKKLDDLQTALSKAQADRITAQSRYEMAVKAPLESLPEVLDDTSLRDYREKLTDLRRSKAQLTASLTDEAPKVKRVQADIDALEAAMSKERDSILKRIHNDFDMATRHEALLTADYDAQSKLVGSQAVSLSHYNILKREADTLRTLYDTMLQKVKEAGVLSAMRATNIRVVDAAIPPGRPYKPNMLRNAMLGLLAGLMSGIVFVLIREREDRTVQGPGEMSFYLNVPELGVIPNDKTSSSRRMSYMAARTLPAAQGSEFIPGLSGQPAAQTKPSLQPSMVAESFRATLSSILFSGDGGQRPRVIVITSAKPAEGKTTVATNLALSLAEINRKVLLIDADLRRPKVHSLFGVASNWGLRDMLADDLPVGRETPWISSGFRDLFLLPVGTSDPGIASLLYSPRLEALIERARGEFDTVIIDTPPMIQISDARIIARMADGVVLVVRSNFTTRDTAVAASRRFVEDGTRIIGTVLNAWDPNKTVGYGYGYDYKKLYRGYDQYYGQPQEKSSSRRL
ncbi:MAG TPA: polysaccharide biosynthesis tyrosine autokinase [Bryobacteraceae bacterium]|nr:polysaccharide biosynthesis tyrosine autokinase [Bryobacteraceae bacterium]